MRNRHSALYLVPARLSLVTGADIDRTKSTCDIDLFSELIRQSIGVGQKIILFVEFLSHGSLSPNCRFQTFLPHLP